MRAAVPRDQRTTNSRDDMQTARGIAAGVGYSLPSVTLIAWLVWAVLA